jgi:hypothetical protein
MSDAAALHRPSSLLPAAPQPQPPSDPATDRARAAAEVEAITLKLRAERRERILAQRILRQSQGAGDVPVDSASAKIEDERAEKEKQAAMGALVAQVQSRAC